MSDELYTYQAGKKVPLRKVPDQFVVRALPEDLTPLGTIQWRAPTVCNNSGIHVRLPKQHLSDFAKLLKTGYEIQLDNTGNRPADQPEFPHPEALFNEYHQTGAIYPVRNKSKDGNAIRVFPAEADLPNPMERLGDLGRGNRIRVVLNGVSVLQYGDYFDLRNPYAKGLIGLQNHFKGFRVQIRHVRIKKGQPAS